MPAQIFCSVDDGAGHSLGAMRCSFMMRRTLWRWVGGTVALSVGGIGSGRERRHDWLLRLSCPPSASA